MQVSRRLMREELDKMMDMQKLKKDRLKQDDKVFGAIFNAKTELEHKKHYENLMRMNKYISSDELNNMSKDDAGDLT